MLAQYKLISHSFPDDPSWIITREDIPLGKIYNIIQINQGHLFNLKTGQKRLVNIGLDIDENQWLVLDNCKLVES